MPGEPYVQGENDSEDVISKLKEMYDSAHKLRDRMSRFIQYQVMFNIVIPTLILTDILLNSYLACSSRVGNATTVLDKHNTTIIVVFPTFIMGSFVTISSMLLIGFALYLIAVFLIHPNPSVRLRNFLTVLAIILHEIAVNGVRDLVLLPWKGLGRILKRMVLGRQGNIDPADVFTPLRVSATGLALSVQIPIIILLVNIILLIKNTIKPHEVLTSGLLLPVQTLTSPGTPVNYKETLHGFLLVLASALLVTYVAIASYTTFKGISKDIDNFRKRMEKLGVTVEVRKIRGEERERNNDFEKEKEMCIALFEEYKNRVSQSKIRGSSRVLVHRYNIFMAYAKELKDVLVVEIRGIGSDGKQRTEVMNLLEYAVKVMKRLYDLRGIKIKEARKVKRAGKGAENLTKKAEDAVYENFFVSYVLTLIMTFSLGASLELTERKSLKNSKEISKTEKVVKSMITLLALAEVLKIRVNVVDLCVTITRLLNGKEKVIQT